MKLTNNNIYTYTTKLLEVFNTPELKLPIKINFYLQKNIETLKPLAVEIEQARNSIVKQYGEQTEDGYLVPEDKVEIVNKELTDLLSIEQEVQIYKIKITELPEDIILSMQQMRALMFMVE